MSNVQWNLKEKNQFSSTYCQKKYVGVKNKQNLENYENSKLWKKFPFLQTESHLPLLVEVRWNKKKGLLNRGLPGIEPGTHLSAWCVLPTSTHTWMAPCGVSNYVYESLVRCYTTTP